LPSTPPVVVGTAITLLDNQAVTGPLDLPPVDLRRFTRFALYGREAMGAVVDARRHPYRHRSERQRSASVPWFRVPPFPAPSIVSLSQATFVVQRLSASRL
jgi:hypothetical protein